MYTDPQAALWQIERGFWMGDGNFYETNLTDDALLAFAPPAGLLSKAEAVASIRNAPRWQDVELEDCHAIFISDCVVLLSYRARGWRAGDERPYSARIVSSYAKRRGRWMLVFHQQTPEGPGVPVSARAETAHPVP